MKRTLLGLISAMFLGTLFTFATPQTSSADDYWEKYWAWHDQTYVPSLTARRSYRRSDMRYAPVQPRYYGGLPVYEGEFYGPVYGRRYGLPNAGYYEDPFGGGEVNVGPIRIGWR